MQKKEAVWFYNKSAFHLKKEFYKELKILMIA